MAKQTIVFGLLLIGLGLYGYLGADPNAMTTEPQSTVTGQAPQANSDDAPETQPESKAADSASEKSGPSKTALIPSAFGLLLLICGTLGLDEKMRKHAMHGAAAVGLVGFLAAGGRLASKLNDLLAGNISRPMTFIILMAILCLVYVLLSVRSFIQARRARSAA